MCLSSSFLVLCTMISYLPMILPSSLLINYCATLNFYQHNIHDPVVAIILLLWLVWYVPGRIWSSIHICAHRKACEAKQLQYANMYSCDGASQNSVMHPAYGNMEWYSLAMHACDSPAAATAHAIPSGPWNYCAFILHLWFFPYLVQCYRSCLRAGFAIRTCVMVDKVCLLLVVLVI
jgi:hypothetical protein